MTFRKNEMPPCLGSGRHSETPITTYQSARRHNPQHLDIQQHRSKNFKPRTDSNWKVRICSETKWFREVSDAEYLLCVKQQVVTGLRATIFNLSAPELFFLNFSTPVYKMWITQTPNTLELWNKLHFEEKRRRVYKTKLRGLSPHANYTDRAAVAGRRS